MFYKDTIKNFQDKGGYFFGRFMSTKLLNSKKVEIAYKFLTSKYCDELSIHRKATEIIIVLAGQCKMLVEDENIILKKEDFLIISPKTKHCTLSTLPKTKLLILKTPSVQNDKELVVE